MLVQRAYKTELKLNNRERTRLAGCACLQLGFAANTVRITANTHKG